MACQSSPFNSPMVGQPDVTGLGESCPLSRIVPPQAKRKFSKFPVARQLTDALPNFRLPRGAHFLSSASQFVTSTSGAVLSVIESTTRNPPSRAMSYASVEMEWRMPAVNNGLAAPICTASPDV